MGQSLVAIIGFGSTTLLAYVLSEHEFGTYKYGMLVFGIFSTLSLSGLHDTLTVYIASSRGVRLASAVKRKCFASIVVSSVVAAVALYYYLSGNSTLGLLCMVIALLLPAYEMASVTPSYLLGKQDYQRAAYYTAIGNGLPLIVVSILAVTGSGVIQLIAGWLIGKIVPLGILTLRELYRERRESNREIVDLAPFTRASFFLTAIVTFALAVESIDKFVIWSKIGSETLALYAISFVFVQNVLTLLAHVTISILPELSKRVDDEAFFSKFRRKVASYFFGLTGLWVLYIFFAPFLFSLFFPKYEISFALVAITGVALIVSPLTSLYSSFFITKEAPRFLFLRSVAYLASFVISYATFYGLEEIYRIALSVACAQTLQLLSLIAFSHLYFRKASFK